MNEETKSNRPRLASGLLTYLKDQAIPLAVLLLMVIIASFISPVFFSRANGENLVVQIAMNMVVSLGMFVVILTGGIDLSVGSIVAVSGVFVAGFMRHMPVGVAILCAVLICVGVGIFNGIIVARLGIAPFIVSLGMLTFARGVAYWYTNSTPIIWSSLPGADFMFWLGSGKLLGIPVLAIIWVLMILITSVMLRRTIIGRIMYAIGGNEEAVKLSGINNVKWKIFPYLWSGLCCGIGGVLLTARLGVGAPTSGDGLELDCIAAVVIGGSSFSGGVGNVSGTVIGVFILGIINNILDLMNVPQYPQMMLKGVIIVAAVIMSSLREKGKN